MGVFSLCVLQVPDVPADLDSLRESLMDQNIIVNVFSTYRKLSSKSVIGIDWQERVISRNNNLQDTKNLPQVIDKSCPDPDGGPWVRPHLHFPGYGF